MKPNTPMKNYTYSNREPPPSRSPSPISVSFVRVTRNDRTRTSADMRLFPVFSRLELGAIALDASIFREWHGGARVRHVR